MTAFVFTGPSLSPVEAAETIDARFLPPVAEGDVFRATLHQPSAIGIIDGYFERVPSVWHKEILYALSQGIPVYGAASMGALRAAELAAFGMRGIGPIFEAFRDGRLEDDDEVTVIHGPAELGYPSLSEAMVNIRRTLADAAAAHVVSGPTRSLLERAAKALPYPDRTYDRVMADARADGASAGEVDAFARWLPAGRVDQKKEDARAMLRAMRADLERRERRTPAPFHFEHTTLWDRAMREAAAREGIAPGRALAA